MKNELIVIDLDKIPGKKAIRNIGFISNGKYFMNTKHLTQTINLCAMVDGAPMIAIDGGKMIGLSASWLLRYADENPEGEIQKALKIHISRIDKQYSLVTEKMA
jgi:hypothetical protein